MKLESFSFRKRNTLNRTQQLSLKKSKKISTSWKTIPWIWLLGCKEWKAKSIVILIRKANNDFQMERSKWNEEDYWWSNLIIDMQTRLKIDLQVAKFQIHLEHSLIRLYRIPNEKMKWYPWNSMKLKRNSKIDEDSEQSFILFIEITHLKKLTLKPIKIQKWIAESFSNYKTLFWNLQWCRKIFRQSEQIRIQA